MAIPMAMPLFTFICPQGHPLPPVEVSSLFLAPALRVVFVQDPRSIPLSLCTISPHSCSRIELKPPSTCAATPSFLYSEVFDSRPIRMGAVISISRVRRIARERTTCSLASNVFLIKQPENGRGAFQEFLKIGRWCCCNFSFL